MDMQDLYRCYKILKNNAITVKLLSREQDFLLLLLYFPFFSCTDR